MAMLVITGWYIWELSMKPCHIKNAIFLHGLKMGGFSRPGKRTLCEMEHGPVEIVDLPIEILEFPIKNGNFP